MARFSETKGLSFLVLDELAPFGVDACVTTRRGGASVGPYESLNLGLHVGDGDASVIENRARVAAALDLTLDDLVFMNQVHGTRVAIATSDTRGRGARFVDDALVGTDAVVTTTPGVALVVLVADCCPIVVVDTANRVLGVAHAGWRGTASGVVGATIEAMCQIGGNPTSMRAVLGPSVEPSRYEVGEEVVDALRRSIPDQSLGFVDQTTGSPHVDVAMVNVAQLEATGIPTGSISVAPVGTGDARFFSDRAARPCGRFALIASLVA
jgi:YfiH family protein